MKADELMVGDWVHIKDALLPPIYSKVYSIYPPYIQLKGELGQFRDDTLAPIPLTPEILEKNFESDDNNFGYQNYRLNANFIIENRGDRFCLVRIVERYYYATFFVCNINYVHQLQHAIYLLGIDKEIVL